MRFFNLLKTDLYRVVFHIDFVIAVLLFGALCFTAEGYADNGSSVSILELALFYKPDDISNRLFLSNYGLFLAGIGPYNLMFAPIIAAIPSIPNFCRERRNGYIRLLIHRCGVAQRCFSFYASALISGGSVVMAGYSLYGLFCLFLFPSMTADAVLTVPIWSGILSQLAGAFVFGLVAVLLPTLLAGISKNTYFVLCAAFSLYYVYCNFLDSLSNRLFYIGELEQSFQVMMFYPTSVFQCMAGYQPWRLIIWICLVIVLCGLLQLCMIWRFDKGA
jgi:hypothetical protein